MMYITTFFRAYSPQQLKLGFAGELTMSDAMDALKKALSDRPATWQKCLASMRALTHGNDFTMRLNQLEEW